MAHNSGSSGDEIAALDRFYRVGGLGETAPIHIHYDDDPKCPHAGCSHEMEWIDFELEVYGDPEGIYKPLVRAWWSGTGFAGQCPSCDQWVHFTSLRMDAVSEDSAQGLPQLPENWHTVAQFA